MTTFLIYSCLPPEPIFFVTFLIRNYSNHTIRIEVYNQNFKIDTINVFQLSDDTISQDYYEDVVANPPPFHGDSVRITYDDSISITHYRIEVQAASRSIWLHESWSGGNTGKNKYEWLYIFTDADYLEALENL